MKNGKDLKLNKHFKNYVFVVAMIFFVATTFFYSVGKDNNENKATKDVLSFVGDIFPRKSTNIKAYNRDGGINNIIDESYRKIIDDSDFTIGNLECCISDKGEAYDKQYTFRLDPENKNIIKDSNIDLLTLANNHSIDYGKDALKDTFKHLDDINVPYIGAGENIDKASKPFETIINGRKYIIYSASSVSPSGEWFATKDYIGINNGYYPKVLAEEIKKRKTDEPDSIIVIYMHWGKEKEDLPNQYQKNSAKILIDAGCDLVIGSHPHVFQNIEYYKGIPIVYSLGNFIYGGTMTDTVLLSAIFDYEDKNDKKVYLKVYPGISGYEKVYSLYTKAKRDKKIKEILDKSPTCILDENDYIIEKK